MTNIYPFKAITPISGLEYGIHNKFIFHSDKKFDFLLAAAATYPGTFLLFEFEHFFIELNVY